MASRKVGSHTKYDGMTQKRKEVRAEAVAGTFRYGVQGWSILGDSNWVIDPQAPVRVRLTRTEVS